MGVGEELAQHSTGMVRGVCRGRGPWAGVGWTRVGVRERGGGLAEAEGSVARQVL